MCRVSWMYCHGIDLKTWPAAQNLVKESGPLFNIDLLCLWFSLKCRSISPEGILWVNVLGCILSMHPDLNLILFSPFRNSTQVRIQWVSRRRQRRHFNFRWSKMSSSTQSLETRRMHTGSHTECVNPTWGNLPLMSWNTSLQREQKQLLSTWSHKHTHTHTDTRS